MRVIAGTARGRRLEVPHAAGARPPLALARGALFNMLAPRLPGARVLDLYAGSGSLGIEALSRGAAAAVFVERDPACRTALAENLRRCGVDARARVLAAEAAAALADVAGAFDLVFLDPPYADAREETAPALVPGAAERLAPDGVLVLRLERTVRAPALPGLALVRDRTYGRSRVCLYEAAAD